MSFISDEFVVFFIIVLSSYFLLPFRFRWILLLVASYFFYAYWNVYYILLIVFSTIVDYIAAIRIESTPEEQQTTRRSFLLLSICVNLGTLFVFKYFNFFSQSANSVLVSLGPDTAAQTHNLLLPVGISFYTFQSMAYTIDVYRGNVAAERHLGRFATYIAFFPQLVAGPIERASNMLGQFKQQHTFNDERMVSGLRLILWGAFKKVVIADRLAAYVNTVYNNVEDYTGVHLMLATFFFAIQIYCDFSGYSDIAIGTARTMGFDLMQNFRQPYFSRSIREFWRRWHISLSTWFRDYVYIPLGGSRVSFSATLRNLMIVFVISGLWHGAAWTFVLWGTIHGFLIVGEIVWDRYVRGGQADTRTAPPWLATVFTFVLVCIGWIFFRANNIQDSFYIVTHLFNFSSGFQIAEPFGGIAPYGAAWLELGMAIATITVLFVADWAAQQPRPFWSLETKTRQLRWAAYYVASLLIIYSVSTTEADFIYFQF